MNNDIDHIVRLERGDVFTSNSGVWLSHVINWCQTIWSRDNRAVYHHAGVITGPHGGTFEALWTTRYGNLMTEHDGARLLIARPFVATDVKNAALDSLISQHLGQWYPWWRLGLHILGPLAKWGVVERLVCSELVAKYLYMTGVRHNVYRGTSPDTLADELKTWRCYAVVYEGTWPPEEPWIWGHEPANGVNAPLHEMGGYDIDCGAAPAQTWCRVRETK